MKFRYDPPFYAKCFTQFGFLLVVSVAIIVSQWGCKNNNIVGTNAPVTVTLSGTVVSSNLATPVAGATVVLFYGSTRDSVVTGNDGAFQFTLDLPDSSGINVNLLVYVTGYNTYSNSFNVKANQTFQVSLSINSADYAVLNGTVRDSASAWPLPGASVVVSLPGASSSTMRYLSYFKSQVKSTSSFIIDSTTTGQLGSFILNIPFPDYLDSVSATMTIAKAGFITYQVVRTFRKGVAENIVVPLQQDKTQSVAHLVGQVVDNRSLLPITNVSVILTSSLMKDTIKTLSDGSYSFDFNLPGASSSVSGTLLFQLSSYNDTTVNFSVNAGQTLTENIELSAKPTVVGGDSNTARGIARSISLVSVTPQEISIHGVGRNETSLLQWQVLDSLGFPIDINHQVSVTFVPTGIPVTLGGAYVTPTVGVTDGAGQISTTLNSGTSAGTIQLIAKLTLSNGTIVQSSPVQVTVDGGLPDQAHFELNSNAPHANNFAGYDWSEVTQGFTVQAGDKYGNPVAPKTAIYFNTSDGLGNPIGGIITGAGQTDATGHANATLYSGKPLPRTPGLNPTYFGSPSDPLLPLLDGAHGFPNDPTYLGGGTGYAYVKASSQGENGVMVADSGLICISASAGPILFNDSVSISPVIIHDSIGSAIVAVHISDRFGNPLEAGTTISATADYTPPSDISGVTWKVAVDGLPTPLGDFLTRGSGRTEFFLVVTASASPANVLTTSPLPFNVTVTVTGRNTGGAQESNTFSGILVW